MIVAVYRTHPIGIIVEFRAIGDNEHGRLANIELELLKRVGSCRSQPVVFGDCSLFFPKKTEEDIPRIKSILREFCIEAQDG
jgi:hypothetical protein